MLTKVTGIIGHPIGHSLSPLMHNTAFGLLEMDYVYLAFDVMPQNLSEALQGLAALGIVGVNVTIPHKESVIPLLDDLSSESRAIGAVNTIVNEEGKLWGHNTDVHGFIEMIKPWENEILEQEVCVIGAGGAARAVVYGLTTQFKPSVIHVLNRNVDRANSLREFFVGSFGFQRMDVVDLYMPTAQEVLWGSKLIVNTTPLGMSPGVDDSPIREPEALKEGQILADLVYNPPETKLMRMAKLSGVKTVGGIEMLLQQGARSFELWTSQKMPLEAVRQALEDHISTL
jgi:shikimate dehydrogenase